MIGAKFLDSSLAGAPQIEYGAGSLISILDACLVNGWGLTAIDALTYDSGTGKCTANFVGGHSFQKDRVIRISGADQAAYNGDFRVESTTVNDVIFTPDAAPGVATATGVTLQAKFAPLDWVRSFDDGVGTKAVYQPDPATRSTQCAIWVDDTNTLTNYNYNSCYSSMVKGVVNPTGLDVWDEQITRDEYAETSLTFPGWVKKAYSTSATTYRKWWMIGDGRFFYLIVRHGNSSSSSYDCPSTYAFGEFKTYRAGDQYNFICQTGRIDQGTYDCSTEFCNLIDGSYNTRVIARGADQLSGRTYYSYMLFKANDMQTPPQATTSAGALTYPNPVNGELVYSYPIEVTESVSGGFTATDTFLRGALPGVAIPLHYKPLNGNTVNDISLNGQTERAVALNVGTTKGYSYSAQILIFLTAGWER
ncbi:hypothetical protein QKW35_20590 [Pontibacterium granulatum]|uniref:hypothetical protein n=1 Tax=Pontibacterium granulatum TaxID=2036029 RepID=UPI00249AB2A5|nr:hypothetical protein [Pontibacterium granulatum]MDI3326782.1 hypothetical protein [Pontibacterium granulatum]